MVFQLATRPQHHHQHHHRHQQQQQQQQQQGHHRRTTSTEEASFDKNSWRKQQEQQHNQQQQAATLLLSLYWAWALLSRKGHVVLHLATRTWETRRPQHHQHHHHQQRQQQQQGQQTHRSHLLAELQPEPPLLPLMMSVGRRPPSRATTISAATGLWYDALLRRSRLACTAFPVAFGQVEGEQFESVDLQLPDGVFSGPGNASRAALVPRVRDTC